jgi:hypothetical protein
LNFRAHFVQIELSYSSRAGECRSSLSLSSKSEKGKVEAVEAWKHKDRKTSSLFGSDRRRSTGSVFEKSQKESELTKLRRDSSLSSLWNRLRWRSYRTKVEEQRFLHRGRESAT